MRRRIRVGRDKHQDRHPVPVLGATMEYEVRVLAKRAQDVFGIGVHLKIAEERARSRTVGTYADRRNRPAEMVNDLTPHLGGPPLVRLALRDMFLFASVGRWPATLALSAS